MCYNKFMKTTTCDFCHKKIKEEPVVAGIGYFPDVELCDDCGSPILKFLQKHKIIDKNKKEIKKS